MSKQTEDTMYAIYEEIEKCGLRKKFDKQIIKMKGQDKHKWKTVCERQEYALKRIKE
tara:strand:+ start:154 stop:324 length:171 start_codon:yes stop_codon:yes gene_type:complete